MADVPPGSAPDQPAAVPPADPTPPFPPAFAPPDPGAVAPPGAGVFAGQEPAAFGPQGPGAFASPDPAGWKPRARRTGWRRWLPMAGLITFMLLAAIGVLLFLGVSFGVAGLTVGLIAAVIPVPILVSAFLWLDRYEPEPVRYLAFCFAWGAGVSTGTALGVNTGAALLFDRWGLPDDLVAVLVAPFIEESIKALGPILLLWRRRAEWSGITDGIVYCGLSALGFAMVENVLYLGGRGYATGAEEYGPATGLQQVFAIFIVRILFTGFAHPLFTAMTGIGLGIAARTGDRRVRWLAPIAGLIMAMILHGLFNLMPTLSVRLAEPLIMLYGYLGFMVPFFFAVVGFAIALRSWEGRLTERILPAYISTGWFSPPEVASLGTLGRRHSARQWAKRVAGTSGQQAMRSFQFAATQLALLRDSLQRGVDHRPQAIYAAQLEEHRLLTEIQQHREAFTNKDPQTPRAFWTGDHYEINFPDGVTRPVAAPSEPVVPVPVRLAAPPAYPGYLRPGFPAAGYPSNPYAPPPFPPMPDQSPWGPQR